VNEVVYIKLRLQDPVTLSSAVGIKAYYQSVLYVSRGFPLTRPMEYVRRESWWGGHKGRCQVRLLSVDQLLITPGAVH